MEYKIQEQLGFTPQIGHLVSMMHYARQTTIEAVKGLTQTELDVVPVKEGNSIGALLFHMAAVEKGFQIEFFDHRVPNEQEMKEWGSAYRLGDQGREHIKGYSLNFYLAKLEEVRERTIEVFRNKNDEWLYEPCLWDGQVSNQYFIWFHVFEDELNHRGQIRLLRKMVLA